jgi:hypothetical protein
MKITLSPDGTMKFIYTDKLRPLMRHGQASIKRVSHVEPTEDNKWHADLSPIQGPILGPYETRAEALQAEVRWLEENL